MSPAIEWLPSAVSQPYRHLPVRQRHLTTGRVVACQRDGTTVLPRGWDHLEVLSSMADLVSGVNGDAPALAVGGAFDDEGVRA